ncbi:MAG: response regulator, partial [Pseudomonadales bacterium]|nr:response regulator [Pseudomonadales bacterium]
SGDPDLAPGNYIRLRVADNGSGIDPEIQERIFEPYFTTKEQGRGTGMGLAVVHGIVRNHGGDIKVHSEVGKGTAFDIFLPLRESRAGSTKTQVAHDAPSGTERILVVDDEAMIAEVMKRILEQLGYCVSSFTSSEEAFEHFASDPYNYDLVVTDMTMPGMTGDVLAERVNAIRPELPLILCSGYNEHLSYERLKRFGVREFVKKPAGVQVWAEAIRRAIDESPADRRRDKRFPVKRGAFVIFRSQATERGRVLDVSMSGLAFRYDDDEGLPDLNDELSIVSPNDGFVVDHVSYETVSDVDANDTGRRRGIRFGNLSPVQLERLGAFIRDYAMEPSQA